MHRERATPAGVWCWPGNTSDSALIRQVKADIRDWNLSLLLIRIIETTTGDTWNDVRRELQRLHVGYFTGPADTYHQPPTTHTTQQRILTRLDLTAPPPDPATQHRLSLAAAAATGDTPCHRSGTRFRRSTPKSATPITQTAAELAARIGPIYSLGGSLGASETLGNSPDYGAIPANFVGIYRYSRFT